MTSTLKFENIHAKCSLCIESLKTDELGVKISKKLKTVIFEFFQLGASALRSRFICDSCYESLTDFSSYRLKIVNKHQQLREFELQTEFLDLIQPKIEVEDKEATVNTDAASFTSILIKEEPFDGFENQSDSQGRNDSCDDDLLQEIDGDVETTRIVTKSKRKTRVDKPQFKCGSCPFKARNQRDLENHLSVAHINGFQCNVCRDFLPTLETLKAHIKTVHDEKPSKEPRKEPPKKPSQPKEKPKPSIKFVTCEQCGKQMQSGSIYLHRLLHGGDLKFHCDKCGRRFSTKYKVHDHLQRHIPIKFRPRNFPCEICGCFYLSAHDVRVHQRNLHVAEVIVEQSFECHCGKTFTKLGGLLRHKKLHDPEYRRSCPHCSKTFSGTTGLKSHLKSFHTKGERERPYMCDLCGKSYRRKNLTVHMLRHGEKTKVCDVPGCDRKFFLKTELNSHMKLFHLKQNDFVCPYEDCENSYGKRDRLERHVAVIHEKIREKCPIDGCKFSVGRFDYMRNHVKKHNELSSEDLNKYLEIVAAMKLVL